MLAFISLLPVVMLLHHVSSHPLSGPEEDTADTAQDRANQHEQVLKTRVTRVTIFSSSMFVLILLFQGHSLVVLALDQVTSRQN